MTDAILFLHVLAAFLLAATTVMVSAGALGATMPGRTVPVANVLWDAGGLGTLAFGVWLAIDLDSYGLLDGWILAALVLWAGAFELGRRTRVAIAEGRPFPGALHWGRTALVVLLLADMIFKPGA